MTLKPLQPKSVMLTARRYGRYCVNDLDAEYAKFALNYTNDGKGSIDLSGCTGAHRARNEIERWESARSSFNLSGLVTIVLRRQRFRDMVCIVHSL